MQFLQLHSSPEEVRVGGRNMSESSHVIAEGLSGQTGVCVGSGGGCWPRLQRGKCQPVLLVGGSGIQDPQPWDYLLSALFRICADGSWVWKPPFPHPQRDWGPTSASGDPESQNSPGCAELVAASGQSSLLSFPRRNLGWAPSA